MTSFKMFVAKEYETLTEPMRKIYGSLENYKGIFINSGGLEEWLETLRGQSVSQGLTNDLVRTYLAYSGRTVEEIPSILAYVCRHYDVELPLTEGILTVDFWQAKIDQMPWLAKAAA